MTLKSLRKIAIEAAAHRGHTIKHFHSLHSHCMTATCERQMTSKSVGTQLHSTVLRIAFNFKDLT